MIATPLFIALLLLGYFVIVWAYYIVFEAMWNGETPGKRWMGLRVIKDGGYHFGGYAKP